METLIGTPAQVKWAKSIRQALHEQYPDIIGRCESVYAQWWIDARGLSLAELIAASNQIKSPFTAKFPRYSRADVTPLLKSMGCFAVLDTETTGLTKTDEIVELSIVALRTGEILFNSVLKPRDMERYLKSKARAMHSIGEDALSSAPTFYEKWEEINAILTMYHPLSYNWAFDGIMLKRSAIAWGIQSPELYGTCVMKMFAAFMETDDSFKLSEALTLMGIDQGSYGIAHTSLADTLATCELLRRMRDSIESE